MNVSSQEQDEERPLRSSVSQPNGQTRGNSIDHTHDDVHHRSVPVKSCNECRQQKLRCDAIKEPFSACSRCHRLGIDCKVDSSFKRVGKRNKYAELQKEIRDLRRQLANQAGATVQGESLDRPQRLVNDSVSYLSPIGNLAPQKQKLEDVAVSGQTLARLYDQFFTSYHPFCPVLDPQLGPDNYFTLSPLLGWTVVLIGARRYPQEPDLLGNLSAPYKKLLWATVAEMPQTYHIVKALSLLCMWPIPMLMDMAKVVQSGGKLGLSEMDPTFMNCGIMTQIALQTGLHRPSHALDFIKQTRDVPDAEIEDRKLTWAVCNIVSQGVSTSNGQPSMGVYNWNLGNGLTTGINKIQPELSHRLAIARFCESVTKNLYSNPSDLVGLVAESQQPAAISFLTTELQNLDKQSLQFSSINKLYHLAAKIHFYSFAFLMERQSPQYFSALSSVYDTATLFIQAVLDIDLHFNSLLQYCPADILKSLVSASCILIKILNSSYAIHFDTVQGKSILNAAILAIRNISLKKNDFSERVAEALARMWRAAGSGSPLDGSRRGQGDLLDLTIRSRMSVSHVYDCIWGWRRTINPQGSILPENPSASIIQESSVTLPPCQFGLSVDGVYGTSSLQDFDLFNSLEWTFDNNPSFDFQ